MQKGMWRTAAAVLVGVAALVPAVTPAQGAKKPVKKVVEVGDYFFTPEKMTVRTGTTVVWRWPEAGGDAHDVYLKKGPKGVKRFQSEVLQADVTYRKKLTVKGRYSIVCTLHPDTMTQTVTVR